MVLSYSAAAQPTVYTPKIISIAGRSPVSTSGSSSSSNPPAAATTSTAATPIQCSTDQSSASQSEQSEQSEAGPSKPRIKHLILDAGPLLSLTPLRHLAENFYTTPAVVGELRDPKAREYFERLGMQGVDVKVWQPSGDALARVMAFARKTGDYAVLSTTDLGVIALTLQYEMKENGLQNVRSEPPSRNTPKKVDAAVPSGFAESGKTATSGSGEGAQAQSLPAGDIMEEAEDEGVALEAGEGEGQALEDDGSDEEGDEDEDAESDNAAEEEISVGPAQSGSNTDINISTTAEDEETDLSPSAAVQMNDLTLSNPPSTGDGIATTSSSTIDASSATTTAAADADEDSESDAGEWITPANVAKHRSRDLGFLPEGGSNTAKEITAACMTGDYAVQNVLLAMGLGLVGEGGKRIGKVKSWVLRCHACFQICKDPSKKFCPKCGNPSLLRTSITTTSAGKTQLHLKKNYQYKLRGTKFTIPDAKPGRAKGQLKGGTGLILREDQREWTDAVKREDVRRGKEEKKILKGWDDPDWLPEIITVGMSGKGRTGSHGLPNIGHGRKNPNIAKKKR